MKFAAIVFAWTSLFAASPAMAVCQKADLRSRDGTAISVHYSNYNLTDGDSAWLNPFIHVTLSPGFCSAEEVQATLVEGQFGYFAAIPSSPLRLSRVSPGSCEFVAQAHDLGYANHGGTFQQQIAVSVTLSDNTVWLVDPVSGSHNFNYSFVNMQGYTPNEEVCP